MFRTIPMITLYHHKRFIWHVFNLLQCVILYNNLDNLAKLWKTMVGKVVCYQLVNLHLQSVSLFWYLTYFHSNVIQFWPALTLWQLGLFNSYTKGKRMWLFWTPFLNSSGVFCLDWYRSYITTLAIGHVMAKYLSLNPLSF